MDAHLTTTRATPDAARVPHRPGRSSLPGSRPDPGRPPGSPAVGVFSHRLDREWQHLRRHRRSIRAARKWRRVNVHLELDHVLAALSDLDQLVDATQSGRPGADAILLDLVRLARSEELAGRVLVQRLLPGLIARAAPYRSHHDGIDPAELAVPAAWLAIRRFDTEHRRHHVAASLVSDATDRAFRQPLRRRAAEEQPSTVATFVSRPARSSRSAIEELAGVVREAAAAGVPATDLDLVRRLARVDSPAELANQQGVTPRTIRNRRDRAVARIRAAVLAA